MSNSKLKVITNNQYRDIIHGSELSEKERAEFDYLSDDEIRCSDFFKYKGEIYDLGEFVAVSNDLLLHNPTFADWHGYQSDSFFSGIVVKYSEDYDQLIVGTYIQ